MERNSGQAAGPGGTAVTDKPLGKAQDKAPSANHSELDDDVGVLVRKRNGGLRPPPAKKKGQRLSKRESSRLASLLDATKKITMSGGARLGPPIARKAKDPATAKPDETPTTPAPAPSVDPPAKPEIEAETASPTPTPPQEVPELTRSPERPKAKHSEAKESGPQTFTRRQTPPQRRRKQSVYGVQRESTLGLRWWHQHFELSTWIGRGLWIGAFVCAWVALSRCLDPNISDPKLSQVPYFALLGWLLCAGLALNQKIPRRFRWTGLVLGAANSVALALSWSFRLDQL